MEEQRPFEKTCLDLPQDTLGALQHIKQGEELARDGKIDAAVDEFKEAQKLDARYITIDPQTKAERFVVFGLLDKGYQLAREENVEAAVFEFKKALAKDSNLTFDPETKAKQGFGSRVS